MPNENYICRELIVCLDTPGWGGAEYDLGRLIAAGAFRADALLLSPFADARLINLANRFGLHTFEHYSSNRISGLFSGLWTGLKLKINRPNTIWIFWCHHVDSNRWLQLGFSLLGVDFILSERICANSRDDFRKSRFTIPLKRFAATASRAVVFCGYGQPALFERIFEVRRGLAFTIPNSRNVSKIAETVKARAAESQALRLKHGIGEEPVFLCSGRLASEKNFKTAILAFQQFMAKGGSGHLVIAGEGPERDSLQNLIREDNARNIHLVGYQSDMLLWLGCAQVFILPSYGEGVSGALIEAMSAGLPCLVSDITGNRELVRHGETGLLFQADDHAELARHMARVCSDRDFRSYMGKTAYHLVFERYNTGIEVSRWQSLIAYLNKASNVI